MTPPNRDQTGIGGVPVTCGSTQTNEAFADSEQYRADGLAWRIDQITSDPSNPSNGSLRSYQAAYQQAAANAAAHTAQPARPAHPTT